MKKDIILAVKDLYVNYYTYAGVVHALNGVSLEIYKGETMGLVGETGCGKSTLGHAIAGLLPNNARITGGSIVLDGEELVGRSPEEMRIIRRDKLAYIFQNPAAALNPVMKVGDQIIEAIMVKENLSKKEAEERALELLKKLGIPEPEKFYKSYPHELSGGMRQRVMIAIALAKNPLLVIADEPTSNLDVTIQAQILELIKSLKKQFRQTTILITHDLGVVAQTCDRVTIMYAGTIVEVGSIYDVFKNPSHPYTQGLLRVVKFSETRSKLPTIPGTVPNLINPPSGCIFHPRCKYAKAICKKMKPELREIENGHFIACHLYNNV